MTHLSRTEAILADLIAFPTISSASNLAIIDHIADLLGAAGARVEIFPDDSGQKANLWATMGPETEGGIVLSGHSDVVPVEGQDWSSDPFTLTCRDDRLYGRGSCDMKGFLAACLQLAETLKDASLTRPLHLCITHDEETGCLGARALLPQLQARGLRPAIAIVGEPSEMRIVDGHKGCFEYSTRFTGLEGHGSAPDRGVNAVAYAARYAARLLDLAEALRSRAPPDSPFDPPWTTINIGRLAGGVATNVIPGKAEIDWEMRPVQPQDAEFVKDALAEYAASGLLPAMRRVSPQACIETQVIGEVVGLLPQADNAARDLVAQLTGHNNRQCVAFGTEAGLFQQMGLSVVICGPGAIAQAHRPDEYVSRAQLSSCIDMLQKLGARLTDKAPPAR